MTENQTSDKASNFLNDGKSQNRILPFQIDGLDLRGKVLNLSTQFDSIVNRHNYPDEVNRLLGEITALCTLLGSSLKFDGKFIVQTQSDGPVELMVVEFRSPSSIRAYAKFDQMRLDEAIASNESEPEKLLGKGHLVMTVDQGQHMQRYQGIVALDGSSLENVAHQYFRQSEQIPTIMRLAVGQLYGLGDEAPKWRMGALMAQFLPESEERMRLRDLPGGDGAQDDETAEDDAWDEARALVATIDDDELLDPNITSEQLIYRLFNQHEIRIYDDLEIIDNCSCTRERIETVIKNLSAEERKEIAVNGEITANCEFCSKTYRFEPTI